MGLQRQAPARPLHDQPDRRLQRFLAPLAVHRLNEEIGEVPLLQRCRVDSLLRPDQLELVAALLDDIRSRLRADAQPVDSLDRGQGAVALDGHPEGPIVKRLDQFEVYLKHRIAAGDDHEPLSFAFPPDRDDPVGEHLRIGELAPALAVGADEIRVAEITLGARALLLPSRPQVAAGKAQEDRAAARLNPLALEREEAFLHRVRHQSPPATIA